MKYTFEIWRSEGMKAEPLIQFYEEKYMGLWDLLNIGTHLESIIPQIKRAENGESELEKNGSERVLLEIRKENSTLTDLFDQYLPEDQLYPTLTLPTSELKQIIQEWIVEREKLIQQIEQEKSDESL